MELTAKIARINYYNKDNGYAVMIVSLEKDQFKILKTKGHLIGNKLVVVGNLDRQPIVDEEYTFEEFIKCLLNAKNNPETYTDSIKKLNLSLNSLDKEPCKSLTTFIKGKL